jgi:hypothetical protein
LDSEAAEDGAVGVDHTPRTALHVDFGQIGLHQVSESFRKGGRFLSNDHTTSIIELVFDSRTLSFFTPKIAPILSDSLRSA